VASTSNDNFPLFPGTMGPYLGILVHDIDASRVHEADADPGGN
jgi:hypothetical protein